MLKSSQSSSIRFVELDDFTTSVRALFQKGGLPAKAVLKVQALQGRIASGWPDPLHGLQTTNHGESRIDHCVKYDLGIGAHRLVTIQHDGLVALAFAGDHDDTDRWLEANRGMTLTRSASGSLETVRRSGINSGAPGAPPSDLSRLTLLSRLSESDVDFLLEGMLRTSARRAEDIESIATDENIEAVCRDQDDQIRAEALLDALLLLRGGEVEEANRRVQLARGKLIPLDEVADLPLVEIRDGETVRLVPVGSPEYARWFDHFVSTADFQRWMLFLHPDQQQWVDRDFAGPTSLTGVSGSGKTAIVVMRAIRLAAANEESETKPVLIVTINRSLALLIGDLVDHACLPEFRNRIFVTSFFEYAQKRLFTLEPQNARSYREVTWKGEEHIDEVWREFYRCYLNDMSAKILDPVHRTLIARGIDAESYLREEMDWIRSGFGEEDIEAYLSVDRSGRHVPFDARARSSVLDGLKAWQKKMVFVGVIDHVGLASSLAKHEDKIEACFSHILVDEAQDFGTLELGILRGLVSEGPNDLFLCGDPVQRVHAKRRVLSQAGIDLPSARSFALSKNYRNSREILSLADAVLVRALEACREAGGDDPELVRIKPELAARSGPVPLLLTANSLTEEIAFALRYAEETEALNTKRICIALAGFSLREVQVFARRIDLPVLDGTIGLGAGKIFLSDLEQTKGYEFDTICVLNCVEGVVPDPRLPIEEQFRVASRFYVAMTRAKRELILSCSGNPSRWLADLPDELAIDKWSENVDMSEVNLFGSPEKLPELPEAIVELGGLNGAEFLYTPFALGMSSERQLRLRELIPGRATFRDGQQVAWRNLSSALFALETRTAARRAFGPDASRYFQDVLSKAGVKPVPDKS